MSKLIAQLEQTRQLKKQLKINSSKVEQQRKELEALVESQKDENDDLSKSIKLVQAQIEEETQRLKELEEKRLRDIAYVEQAHYTSNEEGMGISPNLYEGQN